MDSLPENPFGIVNHHHIAKVRRKSVGSRVQHSLKEKCLNFYTVVHRYMTYPTKKSLKVGVWYDLNCLEYRWLEIEQLTKVELSINWERTWLLKKG